MRLFFFPFFFFFFLLFNWSLSLMIPPTSFFLILQCASVVSKRSLLSPSSLPNHLHFFTSNLFSHSSTQEYSTSHIFFQSIFHRETGNRQTGT
uniref:Putative secreted protein n=1 Tax=Ixodes scapularis TaxID=6945 RepID=A0A4D5RXP6_IXOSC